MFWEEKLLQISFYLEIWQEVKKAKPFAVPELKLIHRGAISDYYESVMMSSLVFMFLTASTTRGFILVLYLADYFIKRDLNLKYYFAFI